MSSIPIKFIRYGLLLKIPHSLDKICERSKENVEIKKVKTAIVHVDEGKHISFTKEASCENVAAFFSIEFESDQHNNATAAPVPHYGSISILSSDNRKVSWLIERLTFPGHSALDGDGRNPLFTVYIGCLGWLKTGWLQSLGDLDLGSQVEFHREIHDLNFRGSSCKNLFVLSSSNRGRLLGFTDLMRQKNKRMKQEGLIQHYGILEDLKSNSSYLLIQCSQTTINAD
ncbi:hypothetical protein Tco_0723363 [Tanacetum coccineum]